MSLSHAYFVVIAFLFAASLNAQSVNFTPLLPSEAAQQVTPRDMSGNGEVIVGSALLPSSAGYNIRLPFRWTKNTGVVLLGDLDGSGTGDAFSVSNDGDTIVGQCRLINGGMDAFRWTLTDGMISLGDFAGSKIGKPSYSAAKGCSSDGSVIVGRGDSENGYEAFMWTVQEGMTTLEGLPVFSESRFGSGAYDISPDGTCIVGYCSIETPGDDNSYRVRAFKWTSEEGWINLDTLSNPEDPNSGSEANFCIDNGAVFGRIFGSNIASGSSAFKWTASEGIVQIPGLRTVTAVSADGSVILGTGQYGELCISTTEAGAQSLQNLLQSQYGTPLSAWQFKYGAGISSDGSKIAVHGIMEYIERGATRNIPNTGALIEFEPNSKPTAIAGPNQQIRAGDTVPLDGSASFDDNTISFLLDYSWAFETIPNGSSASLTSANTAYPSFVADVAGTYTVRLTVTDEDGAISEPDFVEISSENLAPTAIASADPNLTVLGSTVTFDGSSSFDPEGDEITFDWFISQIPDGSTATILNPTSVAPTLVTDVEGVFGITLIVSDLLGPGTPVEVEITAMTTEGLAELCILEANELLENLSPNQVTTAGNQNAMVKLLANAIRHLQNGNNTLAANSLQSAIERTDGCAERGAPDGNGNGLDWVTDCTSQEAVYDALICAYLALNP